ncbi:MAG: chromosome segregation protein SMC, partial [Gammaproteobacteria bacterium]
HKTSAESLRQQIARSTQQQSELSNRCEELKLALASQDSPQHDLRAELEAALKERLTLESRLAEARTKLQALEADSRSDDEARLIAEQKVEERKQVLEQARLEERTIEVRLQELTERIAQTDFSLETMLAELPAELSEQQANETLEKTRARIARLGAINLAAIDEFSQLSERKDYLDAQHEDLINALETLEGAIRKIDKETRTRFRETFDKVNSGFQALFPTLFGGGHAYLELLGEDLLDTGVAVMARPPGKRNSTIHLLSGGEKALTALAFVFSLFELNPAPFCLLDEVDAPLDDANVVRLSEMLKSMSKQVQFMYISHNKITMEIAEQLIGVTMQEAGVSRLVSVDMEEAVEMAQAS